MGQDPLVMSPQIQATDTNPGHDQKVLKDTGDLHKFLYLNSFLQANRIMSGNRLCGELGRLAGRQVSQATSKIGRDLFVVYREETIAEFILSSLARELLVSPKGTRR